MKNNNLKKLIVFCFTIIVLLGIGTGIYQVNAQKIQVIDFEERLKNYGVPVKYVTVSSHVPYVVEIALQSSSDNDALALDDNWFMQLARREATLAYRHSKRLKSYTLIVYNTNGDVLYSTETYLYPEDLNQNLPIPEKPSISNQQTEKIVRELLLFGELSPDELTVISDPAAEDSGQILSITLTTKDLNSANYSLPSFLDSLYQLLDSVNEKYNTFIVLCHLRLLDGEGKILLDYVRDLESGHTQWTSASSLQDGLHSDPGDVFKIAPRETSTPIPASSPEPKTGTATPTLESAYPYP